MTVWHYLGMAAVLGIIVATGVLAGRKVKTAGDFSGSGNAGKTIVIGMVVGTFAGGSCTIGTAQLAFTNGLSAWWFTLGGGLGCVIMALFYASPLYKSGAVTLPEIISKEYGVKAALAATAMSSLGSFLGIISQMLSGVALITTILPVGAVSAVVLTVLIMFCTVVFGGIWGTGRVGAIKTVLITATVLSCGAVALIRQGGLHGFMSVLDNRQYFNIFSRGVSTELGSLVSLLVGVLTTQAYFQAVRAAGSEKIAKSGILISAVIIPVLGAAGILVGLYMRVNCPEINPAAALPQFIMNRLPAPLAGIALGALLLALVATGSGVALGIGTMLSINIYKVRKPDAGDRQMLRVTRLFIAGVLLTAGITASVCPGSLIMNWSFMSMGLRGSGVFGVATASLFLKGKIPKKYAFISILTGPVFTLLAKLAGISVIDPLFIGLAGSVAVMLAGYLSKAAECRLN